MVCRRNRTIPILIGFAILHILLLVSADHDGSDDPLDWLRESIPGEPGVDYPIFSEVETTAFSCKDRVFGGKFIILSVSKHSNKSNFSSFWS